MKRESLETFTLSELCDLLVENTLKLLESLERKADGTTIRDQKREVELLQDLIRQKRMSKTEI
jgi:hypothetical protein